MPILVQKYGGSSVATVEKIQAIAARVVATKRAGNQVVVVVSAMGNTTNELLELARQVSDDPPRRELDMLLSVGERISMALLATAISKLGEQSISFTGSQCGIVTNDSHANARIIEIRPVRVQDELARGRIVIVAGYQGTSYKREITTLGRGGSDTTAVALAAALGAEACDIFSDVPGVYTADPRVVLDAARLESITYEEMQELARQGARVLNAQAVEFARRRQIAVYARSTFGADEFTVIRRADGFPDTALRELGVRGVAGSAKRMLVRFDGATSGQDRSLEVLDALGEVETVYVSTAPSADRLVVLVATDNVPDPEALAQRLRRDFPDTVTAWTGLGTVSAVGLGIGDQPVYLIRALRALRTAGVMVLHAFASRDAVSCVVRDAQVNTGVNALHALFIGEQTPAP